MQNTVCPGNDFISALSRAHSVDLATSVQCSIYVWDCWDQLEPIRSRCPRPEHDFSCLNRLVAHGKRFPEFTCLSVYTFMHTHKYLVLLQTHFARQFRLFLSLRPCWCQQSTTMYHGLSAGIAGTANRITPQRSFIVCPHVVGNSEARSFSTHRVRKLLVWMLQHKACSLHVFLLVISNGNLAPWESCSDKRCNQFV